MSASGAISLSVPVVGDVEAESSRTTSAVTAAAAAGAMDESEASANSAVTNSMFFKSHVLDTAAVIGTVAGTADRCLLGERRNVCAEYDIDEDWCAEQRGHSSTP